MTPRPLDIAAGTGLAAEAALVAVGPTGHVTAADLSPAISSMQISDLDSPAKQAQV